MQKTIQQEAEKYEKQRQRRSIWRKFVRVMACVVVFCTTYALILPAITMEKYICGFSEEHIHSESCYEKLISETAVVSNCSYEDLNVHVHTADCYDEGQNLRCGFADFLVHVHDATCVDEAGNLLCKLPQIRVHEHTGACYQAAEETAHRHDDSCYTRSLGELICQEPESETHTHVEGCYEIISELTCQLEEAAPVEEAEAEPELICDKDVIRLHTHTDACYETYLDEEGKQQKRLICPELEIQEHIHSEGCIAELTVTRTDVNVLTCTLTESHIHGDTCYDQEGTLICQEAENHIHGEMCYGTWALICGKDEHTHTDSCTNLTEEELRQVEDVISLIDTMPSSEQIDERMMELENAGDLTGLDVYFEEISALVCNIHDQYQLLTDDQKTYVTNADKLLALEYMWGEMEEASDFALPNLSGYNLNANNIIPIDGYLGKHAGYANGVLQKYSGQGNYPGLTKQILASTGCNVIYIDLPASTNLAGFFLGSNNATVNGTKQGVFNVDLYNDWCAVSVETCDKYPFFYVRQVVNRDTSDVSRIGRMTNTTTGGFLLLIRRSYITENGLWLPTGEAKNYAYAHLNEEKLTEQTKRVKFEENSGWLPASLSARSTYGYVTLSPMDTVPDAGARTGDLPVVSNIKFKLFNYSNFINKVDRTEKDSDAAGTIHEKYRALAKYFYFRGGFIDAGRDYSLDIAKYIPNVNTNKQDGAGHSLYDQDGYTVNHARVEPNLWDGYPILDFTVDATGKAITPPSGWGTGEKLNARSLRFLFDQSYAYSYKWSDSHKIAAGAVTEYNPKNTILQFNPDTHTYWYNSADNAVDYDIKANMFRVRPYAERTSITADWMFGNSSGSADFLPFNYSNGIVNATYHPDVTDANGKVTRYKMMDSSFRMNDVDYWFGMTMEFTFIQGEDGTITFTNSKGETRTDVMKFTFAGDDDVWVFIDGVRILDMGGTHGTVTGTIDFQTGKVTQKLGGNWEGTDAAAGAHSFPTTLKKAFALAGKTPKGGWDNDGTGTPNQRFGDYTIHTLKFFYLERGTAVANCRIQFNLPNFDNPLIIGKELNAKDENVNADALEYLRENTEYSFRVLECDEDGKIKTDANGNPILFIKEGQAYTIMEQLNARALGETLTVGPNGIFKLKHGQRAVFEDLLKIAGYSDKQFVVQEILPDNQVGQYNEVRYTIESDGGIMVGEDMDDLTDFHGFYSPKIIAAEPQHVQFTNVVDTDKLSVLKVSKQVTEGSNFAADQEFTVEIKLDDKLLPVGTKYVIGETEYVMDEAGVVKLKAGETAQMLVYALAGTKYEVVEKNPDGSWVVTYQSVTTDKDGAETTTATNTGSFNIGDTAHVIVTNSSYLHRIPFTFTKKIYGSTEKPTFKFTIAEWDMDKNAAKTSADVGYSPEGKISLKVTGSQAAKTVHFIFGSKAAYGDYWFKISEATSSDWYENATAYFVHVKLSAEGAEVVGVKKNKVTAEENRMPYDTVFQNYRLSTLQINKLVEGSPASQDQEYSFKLVFAQGSSKLKPTVLAIQGRKYNADGELIETLDYEKKATWEFTLKHGEYIIFNNLPTGLKWTLTEASSDGYRAAWEITDGSTIGSGEGYVSSDTLKKGTNTVVYTNTSTYRLPETGGSGATTYTMVGLMLILCGITYLIYQTKARRKGGYYSP